MSKFITIFFVCWSLCVFAQTPTSSLKDTTVYEWEEEETTINLDVKDQELIEDTLIILQNKDQNTTVLNNDTLFLPTDSLLIDSLVIDSLVVDSISKTSFLQRDSLNNTLHPWTDSTYWESVQSHYIIFDSMSVNPYKLSPLKFKDTLLMVLYDSLQQNWSMPLKDHHVTSNFGQRGRRFHYGTDLRLSIGDSVFSVFDGIVRISKVNPGGYGNYVLVRHYNGLETIYGHLSKRLIKVGQHVKAGELIGYGGNTGRSSGPHLHFEVRYQGNAINPKSLYHFESDTLLHNNFNLTPKHYKYYRDLHRAVYHRIRSGDSLWKISRKYRVSVNKICRLNGISSRTVLRIGRRIRVR